MKKANIVGIVPARGGSKGVPKKNIKEIGGFPMIAYSVIAGQLVENMERCIVSTDSQEIADIAKTYGADVPFLRPSELATDSSTDIEYIKHTIDWFDESDTTPIVSCHGTEDETVPDECGTILNSPNKNFMSSGFTLLLPCTNSS